MCSSYSLLSFPTLTVFAWVSFLRPQPPPGRGSLSTMFPMGKLRFQGAYLSGLRKCWVQGRMHTQISLPPIEDLSQLLAENSPPVSTAPAPTLSHPTRYFQGKPHKTVVSSFSQETIQQLSIASLQNSSWVFQSPP